MENLSRKTVLHLNNSMAMGGIETMILDLARVARQTLFDASVCVFEAGGSLENQARQLGCTVYHIPERKGFNPLAAFRLCKLCREKRVDVLHSHNFASWLYAGLAVGLGAGVRHIHTEHSGVDPSKRRFFLERRLAFQTEEIIAVSNGVKRYMVDHVGIPAGLVRMVYNGVDTARFTFDSHARSRIRSELSMSESAVVMGVVARLAPVKDHAFLLEAMQVLKEANSSAYLMIVGDGDLRSELEREVAALHLSDRTLFLGERQDIPDVMSAMDIYVLPSKSEGMNLTLLEAMSIGLPVVARNVGGNSEIVCNEETGYLVSARDSKELAYALLRLAGNSRERERMGKAGKRRAHSLFNQTATIETYLALYNGGYGHDNRK